MDATTSTITVRDDRSPTAHSRWRGDIQGLRAVAVLLVVVYHVGLSGVLEPAAGGFLSGGFIGVDVFFVISGFVITGLLLPLMQKGDRISFAAFYARRARRLLPALAIMITVVAVLSIALLSPLGPQQETARTGAAASVFAANFELFRNVGYFDLGADNNALLHTWSLAVEEQFYLVFPALLLVMWRVAHGARRWSHLPPVLTFGALVFAITLASFFLSYGMSSRDAAFAFYAAPTRAWEFCAGALLALIVPVLRRIPEWVGVVMGALGAVVLVVGAITIMAANGYPKSAALIPVIGTSLLITAGEATDRGMTRLLAIRPAAWLGDLSYSWYLWHWPMIVFAWALWPTATWQIAFVAAASLVPAWLSHRFVENPIRFDRRIIGRRALALVIVCMTIPLVASLGLSLSAELERHSAAAESVARDVLPLHADAARGCEDIPLGSTRPRGCTFRTPDAIGEIVLAGDSNAGQYTEPMASASNEAGFDLTTATASACPFADVVSERFGFTDFACKAKVDQTLAEIVRDRPSLVVVASDSTLYIRDDQWRLRDTATGFEAVSPKEKAEVLQTGLEKVLRTLKQAGIPALVVHVLPHIDGAEPSSCPALRLLLDAADCAGAISHSAAEQQRNLALTAERQAIAAVPGTSGVDFAQQICGPRHCRAFRDGVWMYRDPDHLSVRGALTLTEHFSELIAERVQPEA